jgi:agmatinase
LAGESFFDLSPEYTIPERARFVIVPVPFDRTSTWHKGADRGPDAIRTASTQVELFDIETGGEPFRAGIAESPDRVDVATSESMIRDVSGIVSKHLGHDTIPVVVGGEHSVTIGAVRAAADRHRDLSVLQLDAHADLRDEYEGSKYNHACVMARVRECCPAVAVGIRSMDSSELSAAETMPVFYAHEIAGRCSEGGSTGNGRAIDRWIDDVVGGLSPSVYITIDLDVFDPSIMPSTGTPEPGGLGWYEVLSLLRAVASRRRIVGFDIVELCPDGSHAAEFLAAKLCYKLFAYIESSRDQTG